MRCHVGGAGCGTRGRGHAAMSPGGSWGYRVVRTTDAGRSRTRKSQWPGYRRGASKDADAPGFGASDSGASRVARRSDPRDVPAKSGTCAFRRAIPLGWGREKERRRRANPRAQQRTGAAKLWLFDNRIRNRSPDGAVSWHHAFLRRRTQFQRNNAFTPVRDKAPRPGRAPRRPTAACRPARTHRSACRRADTSSRRCAATSA